jgi:predicted nucleic acid-binding protein
VAALSQLGLLDNTVLSNFGLVRRADLVSRWAPAACTTPEAYAEYQAGAAKRGLPPSAWAQLPLISLDAAERAVAASLPRPLHAGERTCIAVALRRQGTLASDDRAARAVASRLGVPVTGTLGILALAVRLGEITQDEGNALLTTMIHVGGYISPLPNLDPLLAR